MRIEVNENGEFILKEVYNGIGLETIDKEFFSICMRDSGFEFNYMGTRYEAKNGELRKRGVDDDVLNFGTYIEDEIDSSYNGEGTDGTDTSGDWCDSGEEI